MQNRFEAYDDVTEGADVPADLLREIERLHRSPVPPLSFNAALEGATRPAGVRRLWQPLALAVAVAAGVTLSLTAPSLVGDSTTPVSAEQVIERTRDVVATNAPAEPQPYHLVARSTGPDGATVTTRLWYQDLLHQRSETLDADGNLLFGRTQDGETSWYYGRVDGRLQAVRTDHAGFAVYAGAAFNASSLDQILDMYSQGCTSAELEDDDSVAGRTAHVVEITPDWENCEGKVIHGEDGSVTAQFEATGEEAQGAVFMMLAPDTGMRLWVDRETYVTLRSEVYAGGELINSYEVLEFATGAGAATVDLTPPPGAEVIEVASLEELNAALSKLLPFSAGVEARQLELEPAP